MKFICCSMACSMIRSNRLGRRFKISCPPIESMCERARPGSINSYRMRRD